MVTSGVAVVGGNDEQVALVPNGQGVCLWLTGRSGAGKSTVTGQLVPMLEQRGRCVSVLDVVPELAKHWAERTSEGKLIRKAFVAREVARHGGVAICVTVSARADVRARARSVVGDERFLEIYFDTPREVSAHRKASRSKRPPLIKRARRAARRVRRLGRTGASYQPPTSPDLIVDTTAGTPQDNAKAVLALLEARGFITPVGPDVADDAPASAPIDDRSASRTTHH